jgi:hypothetical protein
MPPYRRHFLQAFILVAIFVCGIFAAAYAARPTDSPRLRWDGKVFSSKQELRNYLVPKGVNWKEFVRLHPVAMAILEGRKPPLLWDGKTFTSKDQLRNYLVTRGVNWDDFVGLHPDAMAILEGRKAPPCQSEKKCEDTTTETTTSTTETTTTAPTEPAPTEPTPTEPTPTSPTETTPTVDSPNIAKNPSVETSLVGVGTLGGARIERSQEWSADGSFAVKVTTPGAAIGEGVWNGRSTVSPGTELELSVRVTAASAMTVRLAIDEFGSSGSYIGGDAGPDVSFSAGDEKTLSHRAVVGSSTAQVTIHVTTRQKVAGSFHADMFVVRAPNAAAPAAPAPTTTPTTTTPSTTTPTTTTPTTPTQSGTYFAGSSPWNTPIGSASVRARSAEWMSALYGTIGGINVNQGGWTPGVFYADGSAARKTVILANGWRMDDVPIPSNLAPSGDNDAHAVIVDTARGRAYDFFGLVRSSTSPSGWAASAGVVFRLGGSGFWNGDLGPWGARASSAALLGGLILKSDVEAGAIAHALACAAPKQLIENGLDGISPVTTGDGSGPAGSMPMGSRLQLDPSLDLSKLPLEAGEVLLARALQQYGCYVVDSTGNGLVLYAQNFKFLPGGVNPYPSSWSNGISKELVRFMRVVEPPSRPTYDDRNVFGQPHQ